MSRQLNPILRQPAESRLIADFTDGSIPANAIVFNSGFPNAVGRAYTYDSRGIGLSFTGGVTGQYASAKWEPSIVSPGAVVDLTHSDWLGLECEFPDGTGSILNGIAVFLTTQTGSTYTNYQNSSLASGTEKTPKRVILMFRLSRGNWTKVGGGPTNLAALGKFEIRMVIHASAQNIPANVFVRKLWSGRCRTKLMFSFDDSMDGQMNYAFPSLAAANMRASLNVAPSQVGLAGRITAADLTTLYAAGWDMGLQQFNDSADIPVNSAGQSGLSSNGLGIATWVNISNIAHLLVPGQRVTVRGALSPAYDGEITVLTTPNAYTFTYAITGTPVTPDTGRATCERLSEKQAKEAWTKSRDWLAARGLTRGNEFGAYSNGVVDSTVEQWMQDIGMKMLRSTRVNAPLAVGFDPRCTTPKSMMRLPAIPMDQQTAATVLGFVDSCIEYGQSCILYGHDIDPTPATLTITKTEWDAIVAGVKFRRDQGLLDVVTYTEFYTSLTNGRAIN